MADRELVVVTMDRVFMSGVGICGMEEGIYGIKGTSKTLEERRATAGFLPERCVELSSESVFGWSIYTPPQKQIPSPIDSAR